MRSLRADPPLSSLTCLLTIVQAPADAISDEDRNDHEETELAAKQIAAFVAQAEQEAAAADGGEAQK